MAGGAISATEKRGAMSLALVFALRMAGLFMIMPVLAVFARHLTGYSPVTVGLAIGAYGLTQAFLQIPMGWLSDRIGRKPVIIGGLVVFAIGSAVAAMSDSMTGIIAGRAIQGMGAIASATLALAADLSREEHRSKVMATIGMSIGLAFAAALVFGPPLASLIGLNGMFWAAALMAFLGILAVWLVVPNVSTHAPKGDVSASFGQFIRAIKNPQLLRLDWSIFSLHLLLTAEFVQFPGRLVDAGLAASHHWMLYLPVLFGSFVLMVPMLIFASKRNQHRGYFMLALGIFLLSNILLLFAHSLPLLVLSSLLFFTGFNYMEASLPAMLASLAPAGQKGSAMGVYSTCQFIGAFIGGSVAGLVLSHLGRTPVVLVAIGVLVIWMLVAMGLKVQSGLKNYTLSYEHGADSNAMAGYLGQLEGVLEAVVIPDERTAYLKVNDKLFDLERARTLVREFGRDVNAA
ncbi:MAG: Inner membrane transport protein YajR [Candidatus Celerinatantimonas neptuna]|nr:MAG: Inner membrane transport protein YajR [Candidatus Celerinatantimonas neptuna]